MPYTIEDQTTHFEIQIWGTIDRFEVLEALATLIRLNPGKQRPDLWTFSDDTSISLDILAAISKSLEHATSTPVAPRSALLAANDFQRGQLMMFPPEVEHLPFEVNVFTDRDKAIEWLDIGDPISRQGYTQAG